MARLTALVALMLCGACATPTSQGHLIMRLRAAAPSTWPRPVPLGESGPLDLTEGALSDAEARTLQPACRASVRKVLGAHGGAVEGQAPSWRLVVSRLVVETAADPRGNRLVRARAVVEVRQGSKSLAAGTGVANVTGKLPSFRSDGVEPREVVSAVEAACTQAIQALLSPPPTVPAERLAAWREAARGEAPGPRLEALEALGALQDPQDAPLFLAALTDANGSVRRLGAWALGETGAAEAAEPLGILCETDPEYAVRVEAVTSLNKLLAVDPSLRPRIRAAREAGALQREAAAARPEAEEPPEESPPSDRVLVDP